MSPAVTTPTAGSASEAGLAAVRRPRSIRVLWLVLLVAVLAAILLLSIAFGSRVVSVQDVIAGLSGSVDGFDHAAVAKRIPRTILAALAGGALALSGTVMQGVTRNPIADPGILGVNMGASLAVVVGIAYFGIASATAYIWVAIVGGCVTAAGVYLVASIGREGATPLKLALAGAASAAALASFISAVVLPRNDIADGVRSWQIGGVGGASYASIREVLPFLVAGLLICLVCARGLNMLALGDELAAGLGQRVVLTRAVASFGAVVLCAAATAVCGPIAFVGLVVPHVCRLLVGPDHRWLMPFAAVTGAALLTAADVLGRVVARPDEIQVGIITALLGAPFFIAIVRRAKVREL